MDTNKTLENYNVVKVRYYCIYCEYCDAHVKSRVKSALISRAAKVGFTTKDAGYDGIYNLCSDCTEGIT